MVCGRFKVGAGAGTDEGSFVNVDASGSTAGVVYMDRDAHANNTATTAIGKSRNKECDRAAARDLAYAMAHARELAGVQELGRARSVG